jgi:transglutaminase-like putative cysteine protease
MSRTPRAMSAPTAAYTALFFGLAFLIVFLIVAIPFGEARAAGSPFTTGPRPRWVTAIEGDIRGEASRSEPTPNGRRYILSDRQVRDVDDASETYSRWAMTITNESGLQDAAQINIEFDPTYQTLVLHSVVVRRGAEVFNRLDPEAVRIIQREPNLEKQVYDGRRSAILFLPDLRVNDTVDYEYTLRGADPTLRGRFTGVAILGAPEPFERLRTRILTPPRRPLHIALHGPERAASAHQPRIEERDGLVEHTWDLRDVPSYTAEADAPSWVEAYPWAQISQFDSWSDAAVWGARLFRSDSPRRTPLSAWVERTMRESSSRGEFLLKAIRFVQDEIRYVGIEVGMARRQPSEPGIVFRRRYGDCKDKTALLVAMARLAGLTASPALVSTTHGRVLEDDWVPTLSAFDHAIARITGEEGNVYWVDSTIALQGGGLDRFKYSEFHRALTHDGRTTHLEELAEAEALSPSPRVRDHFVVAQPGSSGETRLEGERIYEGSFADGMRAQFRMSTVEQSAKEYLKLYEQDFPSIHETATLERLDDREKNVIRVLCHFAIPTLWEKNAKGEYYKAELPARLLENLLKRPSIVNRSMPIAVPYPFHASYAMDVDLPFDLQMQPETLDARSSAFAFHFASAYRARTLSYTYDVTTLAPEVALVDVTDHVAALDKARPALVRALTFRLPIPDGPNWIAIAVVLAFVPLLVWGGIRIFRHEPAVTWTTGVVAPWRFRRLGGWLYVMGLTVVFQPFVHFGQTMGAAPRVLSLAFWREQSTPGLGSYNHALFYAAVLEMILQLAIVSYMAAVLVLFLRRRRSFPLHFTVSAAISVTYMFVDVIAVVWLVPGKGIEEGTIAALVRSAFWAVVWAAYLRGSQRAASTFVTTRAAVGLEDQSEKNVTVTGVAPPAG